MIEFRAKFFGKLKLSDGLTAVTQEEMHSDRLVKLLAFLIIRRDHSCTIGEISDAIWGADSDINSAGAVKNLAWRLRKALKTRWPDLEFLVTFKGSYRFNPCIHVVTDYEEMLELRNAGEKADDIEEQTWYYRQAFDLYDGEFMVNFMDEPWILNQSAYYQNVFISLTLQLADNYEKMGRFDEMESVAEEGLKYEPLDERLWVALIKAKGSAGKYAEAEDAFHKASENLYNSLGIGPSDDLREAYNNALSQVEDDEADIGTVMDELKESSEPQGAYYCSFGVFKKMYELSARRLVRFGFTVHIALITVDLKDADKSSINRNRSIEKAMDAMRESISKSLRTGDVFARYSKTQFVVMLPACEYEMGKNVMKRVFSNFDGTRGTYKYRRTYSLRELQGSVAKNRRETLFVSPDSIRVCVDKYDSEVGISGRIVGMALENPVSFTGLGEFFLIVSRIFDSMGRPQPNDSLRSFEKADEVKEKNEKRVYSFRPSIFHTAEEISLTKGYEATLDIRFTSRSRNTWQGIIADEKGGTCAFDSELELMKKFRLIAGSEEGDISADSGTEPEKTHKKQ